MGRGKKRSFLAAALCLCLGLSGLTGCSPLKAINGALGGGKESGQIQIVYRIASQIPSELDADAEEVAEALAASHELQFVTEAGEVVLDGDDVKSATVKEVENGEFGSRNQKNSSGEKEYQVEITFTEAGAEVFAEVTQANIGKEIAIIYDGELISKPVVQSAIADGKACISGVGSKEEAEEMADMIRIRGLSLKLELDEITED